MSDTPDLSGIVNAQTFRLIRAHDIAPDGEYDFHQWWTSREPRRYLDKLGRRNGTTWAWLVLRCNNTDCRAEAICRADLIGALAEVFMPTPASIEELHNQ